MTPDLQRLAHETPFYDEGHGYDLFGMHLPTVASLAAAGAPLYERYFRVDSRGAEHIPPHGAAILVANHGGVVPLDATILFHDVLRHTDPPRIARSTADWFVPRLPLISTVFARMGMVSGTRANVRRLLERDELISIFPEGVSGVAKRFRDRYKIQDWKVGFAELAMRYRAPVIPVAIIGAEESWPLLAKLPLRMFGSPYIPIPATPLPLPAHFHIRYGEPLHFDHRGADDPELVTAAAGMARHALERLIDDALCERRGVFR